LYANYEIVINEVLNRGDETEYHFAGKNKMIKNSEHLTSLSEEILNEIGRDMFSESGEYAVAVSGGRDSMLLLYFFAGLHEAGYIKKLVVFHFHHSLRNESDDDLALVRQICSEFLLPFYAVQKNIESLSKRLGRSLEETGRIFRYRYLKKICLSKKLNFAVTAHHADDYVESVLIHLIRGGGRSAFSSMNRYAVVDGLKIFRPFAVLNRERIDFYIKQYEIPFREDASNSSDQFLRNRIRQNIMPLLKKEGLSPSHMWKNFHDGFDALWKSSDQISGLDRILVDRNFFNDSSPDIMKNVLDAVMKRLSLPPVSLGVMHELTGQLKTGSSHLHIITGRYILWSGEKGNVWILRKDSPLLRQFNVKNESGSEEYTICYGGMEKKYIISEGSFIALRKEGMRMEIKGGLKKIKKILQESHIPPEVRDCIPLICSIKTGRVEKICLSFIEGLKDRVSEKLS